MQNMLAHGRTQYAESQKSDIRGKAIARQST